MTRVGWDRVMTKIKAGHYRVGRYVIKRCSRGGWTVFKGRQRCLTFVGLRFARAWIEGTIP